MSILRTCIRVCAVAALRDQTWAQDRVSDSNMTPIAAAVAGDTKARPYILVYTDRDDLQPNMGKAEFYRGQTRILQIVLEIGVATGIKDPTGKMTLQLARTDEGMELACDVISAQSIAALVGDPRGLWGDCFKRFMGRCYRVQTVRGGQAQSGIRFAARRVIIAMSTIDDILPGQVLSPNHPVRTFIALANQNPYMMVKDTADVIASLLETRDAPGWRKAQGYLGLDTEAIKHLVPDDTPLPWPEMEEPPLDYSDTNEYPPGLDELSVPADGSQDEFPPIDQP